MRPADWDSRLIETIERHRAADFAWGSYDCATLVRDVAAALGASDPLDGAEWASAAGALREMKMRGAYTMRQYFSARLDRVEVPFAARGDVGFTAEMHPLMCPAIVLGAEAVSRNETGWIVVPRALLVECYRL